MTIRSLSGAFLAAGLLVAAPVFAQTAQTPTKNTVEKQRTDGDAPTVVGPGSQAFKQRTDGEAPAMVGPASGAYKR